MNEVKEIQFNQIYNIDCVEGMRLLPNDCIDLIIADPPFGIDFVNKNKCYARNSSDVLPGYRDINQENYYEFTFKWMKEAYRVLKESGSMYVFSGWNNLKDVLNAIDDVGFITINHIIWKYQFGVYTKRKYITSHYHCLYVCKNDKKRKFFPCGSNSNNKNDKPNHKDLEDVWIINREIWQNCLKTPTKLPAELVKKIIIFSSEEGDIVLDPFMGSGQVIFISKLLKRKYIGFEIVKEYFDFCKKRLEEDLYMIKKEDITYKKQKLF